MQQIAVKEGKLTLINQGGKTPPSPKEVCIRVQAAGVNRADLAQKSGTYPPPPGASEILGLEISGLVESVGSTVSRWKLGDRVMALLAGGGYAEYAVVHEDLCLRVPDFMSFEEAACLPEALFTVWSNLFVVGGFQRGQSALIHGGSSGIGLMAIQLLRAFGASEIFTTVRNKEKAEACLQNGATRAILYRDEDFTKIVKSESKQGGVDLILDMVGGNYLNKNLAALKRFGKVIYIASLSDEMSPLQIGLMMVKNLSVHGTVLRGRPLEEKIQFAKDVREKLMPLVETKKIVPNLFKTFSFSDAEEAHELMESSNHIGKIILKPVTTA